MYQANKEGNMGMVHHVASNSVQSPRSIKSNTEHDVQDDDDVVKQMAEEGIVGTDVADTDAVNSNGIGVINETPYDDNGGSNELQLQKPANIVEHKDNIVDIDDDDIHSGDASDNSSNSKSDSDIEEMFINNDDNNHSTKTPTKTSKYSRQTSKPGTSGKLTNENDNWSKK